MEIVLVELGVTLYHGADEGEATSLPPQGAVSDAGKVAVLVESVLFIDGDDAGILHFAVLDDEVEDELTRLVHIVIVRDIDVFEDFGGGKNRAGIEETREMVAREVVGQRVVGDLEDLALEVLEVGDAHNLLAGLGIEYDEVAEAEAVGDFLPQVLRIALGVLVDE